MKWSLILISIIISNSYIQDTITFISANPFSFKDIIIDLDNQDEQEVFGVLTLPPQIDEGKKIPLIIGVAGSKDWANHHLEYIEMYQDMGIATFELQSFRSRQIKSTVGTQVEVTTAMIILDSYRAFEKLLEYRKQFDTDIKETYIWKNVSLLLEKYTPFVKIDYWKYRRLLLDKVKEWQK